MVITGGTGSLGQVLARRILSGDYGIPKKLVIFSRDEAKQFFMRTNFLENRSLTEEVIYKDFEKILEFRIGDIRDYHSVTQVLKNADIVINAAALKQVPSCEITPYEAVQTNVLGAENVIRAIEENRFPVEAVACISTDKACKPVNVMGMTKAIQERMFVAANIRVPGVRFVNVRYGNVLISRGSVIPLFIDQIKKGGPVTLTMKEMTRYLLPLEQAVDAVMAALDSALPGETYVPIMPSALILNIAKALIGKRKIEIAYLGIRPGEKIHEGAISFEEGSRTFKRGDYYVIRPILPQISQYFIDGEPLGREYSSNDNVMTLAQTQAHLEKYGITVDNMIKPEGESQL